MVGSETVNAVTVYDKPFFVNELLDAIHPEKITPNVFKELVNESRVYDLSAILTATTRQIDVSGLVPNFAGVYDNPEDVLEALMELGHLQLLKIHQYDQELQDEIFSTIEGGAFNSFRALLILDQCQYEVIQELTNLRHSSPLAMAIRKSTEEALKNLYRDPFRLRSPMFDEVIHLGDRLCIYEGEPRICYPHRVVNGAVVEVWQFFIMPKIKNIRLPAEYQFKSVGDIIESITPRVFKRDYNNIQRFDPRTPSGFIGLLGKVGGALPRLIARQVKRNKQLRALMMDEEALTAELFELFTHH